MIDVACKVWLTLLAWNLVVHFLRAVSFLSFVSSVQVCRAPASFSPVWSHAAAFLPIISPRKSKPAALRGSMGPSDIFTNSFFPAGKNNENGPKQVNWKGILWTLVTSVGNSEVFISISRSLSLIWQGGEEQKGWFRASKADRKQRRGETLINAWFRGPTNWVNDESRYFAW